MRVHYLKAALVGLVGGVLLTAAILSVEVVYGDSVMAALMANCADVVCDGYAQVGDLKPLAVPFGIGFAAAFIWFRRRQRRLVAKRPCALDQCRGAHSQPTASSSSECRWRSACTP
jgi:hypothetical protein